MHVAQSCKSSLIMNLGLVKPNPAGWMNLLDIQIIPLNFFIALL